MQEPSADHWEGSVPLPSPNVFDWLDEEALTCLEAELAWFSLPGGSTLFRRGDPPSGLFMVLTGCLGVVMGNITLDEPAALLGPGEVVGEYSLLLNRPQAATCIAIRDTSLAWLSSESFHALVRLYPGAVLPFAAQLIEMYNRILSFRHKAYTVPKTIGLIPLHPGSPVEELAAALVTAVAGDRTRLNARWKKFTR
jgi:NTE family protein